MNLGPVFMLGDTNNRWVRSYRGWTWCLCRMLYLLTVSSSNSSYLTWSPSLCATIHTNYNIAITYQICSLIFLPPNSTVLILKSIPAIHQHNRLFAHLAVKLHRVPQTVSQNFFLQESADSDKISSV